VTTADRGPGASGARPPMTPPATNCAAGESETSPSARSDTDTCNGGGSRGGGEGAAWRCMVSAKELQAMVEAMEAEAMGCPLDRGAPAARQRRTAAAQRIHEVGAMAASGAYVVSNPPAPPRPLSAHCLFPLIPPYQLPPPHSPPSTAPCRDVPVSFSPPPPHPLPAPGQPPPYKLFAALPLCSFVLIPSSLTQPPRTHPLFIPHQYLLIFFLSPST
jgi:hypothetical protein